MKKSSRSALAGRRGAAAALVAGIAAAVLTGTPAHAATDDAVLFYASYQNNGQLVVFNGGDHANNVSVDVGASSIVITDTAAVNLTAQAPCAVTSSTTVVCPKELPGADSPGERVVGVAVNGHDGDDTLTSSGFGLISGQTFRPISVGLSGWAGDDTLVATGGLSHLLGGPGDDSLTSGPGYPAYPHSKDRLSGQDGNDTINSVTNSPDVDEIACDEMTNMSFTDWLTRDSGDIAGVWSGCDNVTIQ
ncbi:hypothetical protein [Streptosporangium sp. OZ121]|uniref:hypothetical protein n=1 Tax=Streptosporangium sp. OZ121 TaxID=3444183 RepID=UPI003F7AA094